MAGFLALYERLINLEVEGELWVDGSFLTHKPEPDDIDFVVLISHYDFYAAKGARKEFFDWLIDNEDEPKQAFSCHTQIVLFADETHPEYEDIERVKAHWKNIYGLSVATREPKGIAVVKLFEPSPKNGDEPGKDVKIDEGVAQ